MKWLGTWRNQYGSTLRVTDEEGYEIRGSFRTALSDSSFFGQELPVLGVHSGDCLSFTFAGRTDHGDAICSFTGLLREGKLQTLWHLIADSRAGSGAGSPSESLEKTRWPHAAQTNADTFERSDR
ncbi:MAG TPA: avidin/streptavidin family protein [Steroidobacteraceae bacterium]|nr:avidin/streptavidin family protein [Steroidobacteraceae bacterium]